MTIHPYFFSMDQNTKDFNKCVRTILSCETNEQAVGALRLAELYHIKHKDSEINDLNYGILMGIQLGLTFGKLIQKDYDRVIKLLDRYYPVEVSDKDAER